MYTVTISAIWPLHGDASIKADRSTLEENLPPTTSPLTTPEQEPTEESCYVHLTSKHSGSAILRTQREAPQRTYGLMQRFQGHESLKFPLIISKSHFCRIKPWPQKLKRVIYLVNASHSILLGHIFQTGGYVIVCCKATLLFFSFSLSVGIYNSSQSPIKASGSVSCMRIKLSSSISKWHATKM